MPKHLVSVAVVSSALLLLAACGSGDEQSSATTPTTTTTASISPSASGSASEAAKEEGPTSTVDGVTVSGPKGGQPVITVTPGAPAPTTLVSQDVYVGEGKELTVGGAGSFQYEGVLFSDGVEFDSSWARGEPIQLSLNQVIPGWQTGLVGMKEGGRRLLIIPPDQAYGQRALAGIPPNSTLVFVVDLEQVLN